ERVYDFSLNDNSQNFIRRVFNTNPQLFTSGNFYPSAAESFYWLGETYEQEIRDSVSDVSSAMFGVILPIHLSSSSGTSPANRYGSTAQAREAVAGWFISQDTGPAGDFNVVSKTTKLFRLIGRGHGAWLNNNVKISISNIRYSNSSTTDYGTFSVLVRSISDTDSAQQVLERFDNLNLDPTSPNYIGRKIGDQYTVWVESERRLKTYGEYPNQSKYIYVDVAADVAAGASGMETLLPFGYYGPPKYKDVGKVLVSNLKSDAAYGRTNPVGDDAFLYVCTGSDGTAITGYEALNGFVLSASLATGSVVPLKLTYPAVRLRNSASDGGISDPRNAFFGMDVGREATSTRYDRSVAGVHSMLSNQFADKADPTATTYGGLDSFAYVFTLDNVVDANAGVGDATMFYRSGSRADGTSYTALSGKTYKDLIDAGFNNFTAPMWGGFDGFNIKLPDPLYNDGMSSGTEKTSAAYYTIKRAIDTVADPEVVETNLLAMPGLTNTSLTQHMINVCEERADALAVIDLPDVYLPAAEGDYSNKSTKASRIATTPTAAATALRDRRINSSYGCTFYPWVQTRDERTGAAVWLPPSAAMLGVLASSERKAQLWFAPAGFNRGGLSDGAAGIPVSSVTEKLTSKQRDLLYEANINPIASFPSTGIVVFGQKTLQEGQSALDRINVRRLVIYLKKEISRISTQILFEQNVQTTWNRFIGLVEPFLANVKSNFGISDYKLILDESTTTPDLVDQNIMYAKIMVKPARAIEYIAIDFVIASTGASFDD
ncbi:MAG: phage tail sheath C-terminal domain-containing protein, partial [Opitutae bacterium]